MSKRLKAIFAVILAAAAVCAVAAVVNAFTARDSAFTFNAPMLIGVNTTVNGQIINASDTETYMFEVKDSGALSLLLEQEELKDIVDDGWHITIYKMENDKAKTYSELANYKAYINTVTSSWSEVGIGPGTYLIVVEAGTVFIPGEFDLTVFFNKTENYERETNDTKETATPIAINVARFGSSSERSSGVDSDWYVFEIKSDMTVEVEFNHAKETMPQSGWVVSVLNEKDDVLSDFSSDLNSTKRTSGILGLKTGKYYVCVDSQVLSDITYSLLVTARVHKDYEFEFNNTAADANTLPIGKTMHGSLAPRILAIDHDYWKFTVESDCVADLSFTHADLIEDASGWNVRILRETAGGTEEFIKKVSNWNQTELNINGIGLKAGTYYVCIDADSLEINNAEYGLTVTTSQNAAYETETNNDMASAKEMTLNKYCYGALISSNVNYDVDFYKFTLTEQKRVSVEFAHAANPEDSRTGWTISILDSAGKKVFAYDSTCNRDYVSSEVLNLPAGTYYVKVENGLESVETPYSVRLVGAN